MNMGLPVKGEVKGQHGNGNTRTFKLPTVRKGEEVGKRKLSRIDLTCRRRGKKWKRMNRRWSEE